MKAVVLAGGYGKRLRPYTEKVPKHLLEVAGKPLIVWQFEWLKKHGITDIIICAGYLKEKTLEVIGSGQKYGVNVGYAVEDEPLGTGGALLNTSHLLDNEEKFIVVNGDILTDLNPLTVAEALHDDLVGCIALVPLQSPFGVIDFNINSYSITKFREKPIIEGYWINAGVYAFNAKVFKWLPKKGQIEEDTFPKLAFKGLLRAVPFKGCFWKSIDSHKDLEEVSKILKQAVL